MLIHYIALRKVDIVLEELQRQTRILLNSF